MLAKTYIKDLQLDAYVQSTFLVTAKTIKQTRHGDDFLMTTLTDKTGSIEARAWEKVEILATRFDVGNFVAISGVVTEFQDIQQIQLLDMECLSSQAIDPTDYLPAAQWPHADMFDQLVTLLQTELVVEPLRQFVQTLFAQSWLMDKFKLSPAATKNHHQYLSGLLEHILSMMRVALGLANHYGHYYPGLINKDLLLVGCFLHDLGKCMELSFEQNIAYTTPGRLLGHITQGVQIIDGVVAQMHPAPPEDMVMELKHLVLSHHGKLEYGSPVRPQTPEAILLHQIDMIDSRLNMCAQAIEQTNDDKSWTAYQRTLEGRLYIGDRTQHDWRPKPRLNKTQLQGPGAQTGIAPQTQHNIPLTPQKQQNIQQHTLNLFQDDT